MGAGRCGGRAGVLRYRAYHGRLSVRVLLRPEGFGR